MTDDKVLPMILARLDEVSDEIKALRLDLKGDVDRTHQRIDALEVRVRTLETSRRDTARCWR